ncbi:MAG: hypothetical protein IPO63_00945 [Bacteroidetes bacterium]|nr:hypothetical protein [Bacteroidota bacterium]
MENTTRPFAEDIKKTLQSLNLQVENWMNSQQPISLLEKDLIKENMRALYQLIDELAVNKKLEIVHPEIQLEKSEVLVELIPQPTVKISEEVTHTIRNAETRTESISAAQNEVTPVTNSSLYSSSIKEMIENATVINSVEKTVNTSELNESIEEKTTAPIIIHHAIEEKTIEARIQEVKAATRYEEIRTIGSTYAPGESVSDKIHKTQTEKSVSDKIKTQPLVDLKLSIGINERFAFINELFQGDQQLYHQSIDKINSMHVYEEAQQMIHHELMQKLNWSENNSRLQEFDKLVKRRFNS